jgi:hypothetical protein
MLGQAILLLIGTATLVAGLFVLPFPPLLAIPVFLLAQGAIAALGYAAYNDRILGGDPDSGGEAVSAIVWVWFLFSLGLGAIYSMVAGEPFLFRGLSIGVLVVSDLCGLIGVWVLARYLSERRQGSKKARGRA